MGDKIFSTLSAVSSARSTKQGNQTNRPHSPQTIEQALPIVEDVAFEVIAVTDYAEVELGTSGDSGVVVVDASRAEPHDCLFLPNELISQGEVIIESSQEETQEKDAQCLEVIAYNEDDNQADLPSCSQRNPAGPHDCPDCKKKFKFASSLIAHRVIHTGERPHRCGDCGRCFSFRQSLDRHKQTHRSSCQTFHLLAPQGGVYSCCQCLGTFSSETVLAKHLKSHAAEQSANQLEVEVVNTPGCQQLPDEVQAGSNSPAVESQAGLCLKVDSRSASVVTVRTSGRKRRPTMKIQVINRQKHMATERQAVNNKKSRAKLKPVPVNW